MTWPPAAGSGRPPRWRPTSGLSVSALVGVGLLLIGILTGRIQVAVLAAPLLLTPARLWLGRPGGSGRVTMSTDADATGSRVAAVIAWQPARGTEALRIRASAPGHRSVDAVLASATPLRRTTVSIRTARTGRRPIFTVDHAELAGQQLVTAAGDTAGPVPVTVLPRTDLLREVPLPHRLQGLTGPHDSRRAGEGNDLRDINLFTPGDRLRRIDWRVTARRNSGGPGAAVTDLYVRRSYATADAAVMIVLDSRDEVGPDLTTWNDSSRIPEDEPTSLDRARTAALSLARRYLQAGDRVGLEDLGRMRRPVPPAGGQRQLRRLTMRIALAEPEGEPRARQRPPRMPSGALIIICSTFLDEETGRLAQLWHGAGHRVVAVDVLPEPDLRSASQRLLTAYRIIAMDRADRLAALARSGVEVVGWTETDSGPLHRHRRERSGERPVQVALAALSRRRAHR